MSGIEWKIVPQRPTEGMLEAALGVCQGGDSWRISLQCQTEWDKMIKAAPLLPSHAHLIGGTEKGVWTFVPVEPTSEMIAASVGAMDDEDCRFCRSDKVTSIVGRWKKMLAASPTFTDFTIVGKPITLEELARHLFESDDPDVEELSWPDHDDDDGCRGDGGWVKLASPITVEEYREKARELLRFMGCGVSR